MSATPVIALKVQRRRYARAAAREVSLHHLLRQGGPCPEVVSLYECFLHDGHICMAFEKHECSLRTALKNGPLPVARVRRVTRQILTALERLHRCGFAHRDVKPGNILYDPDSGGARLADLGSATDRLRQGSSFGTREYRAPEVIIGAPLGVEVDLWGLGCTVFEMLTGRLLFAPYRAAARKYHEFSREAPPIELAQSVFEDEAEEDSEQLRTDEVVAEKYMLVSELGRGAFATVWSARALHERPLGQSFAPLWDHAEAVSSTLRPASERERADLQWQREKGADDLLDLALNYEHILLIIALCGPVPAQQIAAARYRSSYFEPDGELRFRPAIRRTTIRERLRRGSTLTASERAEAAGFIRQLLTIDPAVRATATAALAHSFVN
jgi:serine/threonine protein kinase